MTAARSARRPRALAAAVAPAAAVALVAVLGSGCAAGAGARPPVAAARIVSAAGPSGAISPSTPTAAQPAPSDAADAGAAWLSSSELPELGTAYADLLRSALLDIRTLTSPGGAVVAAPWRAWHYVWPRDASFVAVALARVGRVEDAQDVLGFLQRVQPAGGLFQARYRPDRSGPPDARGIESDSTGFVLWAIRQVWLAEPTAQARAALLQSLRPLVDRSTSAALALTGGPSRLPAPSLDYWELPDRRLSLGTAAPVAAGLSAAAELYRSLGRPDTAANLDARGTQVYAAITASFGPGYSRFAGTGAQDASLSFLLPPFTRSADPAVLAAWRSSAAAMARPGGGLAPGAGWPESGLSWTPETALYALTAAGVGDRVTSLHYLAWLRDHRTSAGALPEKVDAAGAPAGPAPLAWTAALVLLTAAELSATPPS